MAAYKFLHTADIYLDSPLHGLSRSEGVPVEQVSPGDPHGADQPCRFRLEEAVGQLVCERCGLNPVPAFADADEACIEAHQHALRTKDMQEEHWTRPEDLQCPCANCHRLVLALCGGRLVAGPFLERRRALHQRVITPASRRLSDGAPASIAPVRSAHHAGKKSFEVSRLRASSTMRGSKIRCLR